jgi:hypothetical protein
MSQGTATSDPSLPALRYATVGLSLAALALATWLLVTGSVNASVTTIAIVHGFGGIFVNSFSASRLGADLSRSELSSYYGSTRTWLCRRIPMFCLALNRLAYSKPSTEQLRSHEEHKKLFRLGQLMWCFAVIVFLTARTLAPSAFEY